LFSGNIELAVYASSLSENGNVGEVVGVDLRVELVRPCLSPPAGLLAWWPGDGHALDLITGNSGLLQNGATANAPGLVGQAFQFDGLDDKLLLPNTGLGALDLTGPQLT
jgi:hypothetical protein